MTYCYLGLGSNLNSPVRQLRKAIGLLRTLPQTIIVAQSSLYISRPLGVRAQPNYCNIVILINTTLSPMHMLTQCQSIENKLKRLRKTHWGPRTIDIDILLFGMKTIKNKSLVIPHPQLLKRDFVLFPLLEISPNVTLPTGKHVSAYLVEHAESLQKFVVNKNLRHKNLRPIGSPRLPAI